MIPVDTNPDSPSILLDEEGRVLSETPVRSVGRPRGIRAKIKQDAVALMERCRFDPMKASIDIAKGKKNGEPHPFLQDLRKHLDEILEEPDQDKVKKRIDLLWKIAEKKLGNSSVNLEIQSKHILALTEYIYQKPKSVDVNLIHGISVSDLLPLSSIEVMELYDRFEKDF